LNRLGYAIGDVVRIGLSAGLYVRAMSRDHEPRCRMRRCRAVGRSRWLCYNTSSGR
jgi:hypothetical protein